MLLPIPSYSSFIKEVEDINEKFITKNDQLIQEMTEKLLEKLNGNLSDYNVKGEEIITSVKFTEIKSVKIDKSNVGLAQDCLMVIVDQFKLNGWKLKEFNCYETSYYIIFIL